jgi:hypothetical protein
MNVQPNLRMDKATFLAWLQEREERYELAGASGFAPGPEVITGLDGRIRVATLGIDVALSGIYAGIHTN